MHNFVLCDWLLLKVYQCYVFTVIQNLVLKHQMKQGGDSAAGAQALPVGKIIDDKVCRKESQKDIAHLHMLKDV